MNSISAITNQLVSDIAKAQNARAPQPAAGSADQQTSDSVNLSLAGLRTLFQAGRIQLNEQAGRITSEQADDLLQQFQSIEDQIKTDKQANGNNALTPDQAKAINDLQNTLSQSIYSTAQGQNFDVTA
jgi:hypothetical protein